MGTAAGTTLLVGLNAGLITKPAASAPAVGTTRGGTAVGTPHAGTAGAGPTGRPSAAASPAGAKLRDGTFAGALVTTKYGNVQVRVTVGGARLTDVTAVSLPGGNANSDQISARAAPMLRQEALT